MTYSYFNFGKPTYQQAVSVCKIGLPKKLYYLTFGTLNRNDFTDSNAHGNAILGILSQSTEG